MINNAKAKIFAEINKEQNTSMTPNPNKVKTKLATSTNLQGTSPA